MCRSTRAAAELALCGRRPSSPGPAGGGLRRPWASAPKAAPRPAWLPAPRPRVTRCGRRTSWCANTPNTPCCPRFRRRLRGARGRPGSSSKAACSADRTALGAQDGAGGGSERPPSPAWGTPPPTVRGGDRPPSLTPLTTQMPRPNSHPGEAPGETADSGRPCAGPGARGHSRTRRQRKGPAGPGGVGTNGASRKGRHAGPAGTVGPRRLQAHGPASCVVTGVPGKPAADAAVPRRGKRSRTPRPP